VYEDKRYDLLIIGAGPAGMTAAVYAARKKLDTLVISKDVGGQTILASGVETYMGYQSISGAELIRGAGPAIPDCVLDRRGGHSAQGRRYFFCRTNDSG
jgi:alkyl hydroperoxide reductase subunit AhpF